MLFTIIINIFRFIWSFNFTKNTIQFFCKIFSINPIREILLYNIIPFINDKDNCYIFPKIKTNLDSLTRSVIVLMPFYSNNAATKYYNQCSKILKNNGFNLIGIVYGDTDIQIDKSIYDESYTLKPQHSLYRKIYENPNFHNSIDEWIGDDIINFISSIRNLRDIRAICIHYVFLSKIFNFFPNDIPKLLFTHDIYSYRNNILKQIGMPIESFYYSTNHTNEKIGLERASTIFSIQQNETDFFKEKYGFSNIETIPYIPKKNFLPSRTSYNNYQLNIGYIGSRHYPNIHAINKFISLLFKPNFTLIIGGEICDYLNIKHTKFIFKYGLVDNLYNFYNDCDIIINPDLLESGLKIKTLEALSFGKPLICTKQAISGINSIEKYHNALSIEECVKYVYELTNNLELIENLRITSQNIFEQFSSNYPIEKLLLKHIYNEEYISK